MSYLKHILFAAVMTFLLSACNTPTEEKTEDTTTPETEATDAGTDNAAERSETEAGKEEATGSLSELEIMEKEVMRIHDEAMMKVNKVRSLKEKMEARVKELDGADEQMIKVGKSIIDQLGRADKAMNDWMNEYEAPAEDFPIEGAIAYFENEEEKITAVRSSMESSIEVAEAFLKSTEEATE